MGGGDHNMSDVLEDHGSVQVDDVVAGQDFDHGGVHEHEDDDLDENEYGEGDLQIDRLDPIVEDTFDILVGNSPLRYIGCDRSGSHSYLIYQTPNGTRFWCPDVTSDQKPMVGNIYDSWDQVYKMYETYAEFSGFGIRISGCKKWKGQITHRVTDCKALIRLKAIKGEPKYLLYEFVENHNHELISSDNMDLTRKGRHLNFEDIQFVHKMSLNKVGPTVAHRSQTSLKGGHHNMRGTRSAFTNVSRDITMFIGDRDIQLVVQELEERAKNLPNFSYDFFHVGHELKAIFWADDLSKVNYRMFGDVLGFDATFSTNKYNMIFVPFTGVDHHKRCVTFGAGLIDNETIESYQWLLSAFLKIHVREPLLVLTNRDPAMRVAVPLVFKKAFHRLCMWHIMKKLPSKICSDLLANSTLRSSIHKLVWNIYISPSTFEERWINLRFQFNLGDHVWLSEMFVIRDLWVPAYFRDTLMSCLMKTTSRCESSNALFKVNSTAANTLVQFMMCFDTAIDNQCYNQRILEFQTSNSRRDLRCGLDIEAHAYEIYTHYVFKDVQKEIFKGMMNCFISNVDVVDQSKVFTISHMDHNMDFVNKFKVSAHMHDNSVECTCIGFSRIGYLCRHIFRVLRVMKIKEIPNRYVAKRWRR
ncbi:hypothetical protein E3N88_41108 [Mikania micrantha]|uniref:SWIM-type domain-containing protein n=1 Tax=Mikania micrantha TaxID=192012 RepID=A0A5N6LQG9_9ASTR|nr:hypothetical protein E3N88_41108 [Mikania micrantha]